jgi:Uma2 family endonuclease
MSTIREITLPVTEPATEWVNGRALQKLSPREEHGRIQLRLGAALFAWAEKAGAGRVSSEWEFRVTPPGEATRPLVPDIAFLSFERLGYAQDEAAQIPYLAPDAAIEIVSPGDRRDDLEDKIRVYLAAGAKLVLLVDPVQRSFVAHDAMGARRFSSDALFTHTALPGFSVPVASVFEPLKPKL